MSDSTPFPAAIIMTDHSQMIGTTAMQIFAPNQLGPGIRYMRLVNSGLNNGTIWYSRSGPAAVNAIGSYALPPGSEEVWDGNFIPVNQLWAISTQPNMLLQVEVG